MVTRGGVVAALGLGVAILAACSSGSNGKSTGGGSGSSGSGSGSSSSGSSSGSALGGDAGYCGPESQVTSLTFTNIAGATLHNASGASTNGSGGSCSGEGPGAISNGVSITYDATTPQLAFCATGDMTTGVNPGFGFRVTIVGNIIDGATFPFVVFGGNTSVTVPQAAGTAIAEYTEGYGTEQGDWVSTGTGSITVVCAAPPFDFTATFTGVGMGPRPAVAVLSSGTFSLSGSSTYIVPE
ncbi:MAG: hypothetical protein ACLQVI_43845 [Polyangiaceae bacterium]|jgi:hypothetical protein